MSEPRSSVLTPEQHAELRRRLAGRAGQSRRRSAAEAGEPAAAGCPLSATQYQLWLAEQVHGASSAYTLPIALRISGPLDAARLQECLDLLAGRHAALRSRVATDGGVPRQYFDLPARISLETRDLSLVAEREEEHEAALADALRAEADHVFTLARPPYVRAVLLRRRGREHALILTVHHAFCDGVSLEVLVTELFEAYSVTEPLARDPGAQHADYARWEHSADGRARLARNAAYWEAVHRDLPELPKPPFADGGVPGGQDEPTAAFALPTGLRQRALELSRSAAATMHAVWLAGFAVTWHLVSGAKALSLAVPVANRPESRFDKAVGAFVSAIPLVLRTRPEDTFAGLVRTCADTLFDGADHAVLSGEMTQLLSPAVLFSLTGEDAAPMTTGELTVSLIPLRVQGSQHMLTVQLIERTDGVLYGEFRGRAAHYRSADLSRLAAAYPRCMEALLASPHVPLAALGLLSETEQAVVARWSSATDPSAPALPYEAFRHWVQETPEAFAALDPNGTEVSYRRLDERVAVFAQALHAEGVGAGVPVAICLPRCVDYLALTLAVWHLGGWVIPLNATDPPGRITMLLAASPARYIVGTGASMTTGVASLDVARLAVQPIAGSVPVMFEVRPDDIAYGVFTSGTTGMPKCVAVGHGALANQLAWRRTAIGVGPGDRVLQTIPLAFDPAFWQCFGPLAAGAGVIMAAPAAEIAQAAFVDSAVRHQATIVDLVPSLLASLTDEDLSRLPARVVFCGGEALPAAEAERYQRLGSGVLYNQYGPSETCIDATSLRVEATLAPGGMVPIGRPIGGVRLHILDPALRQVPAGIPGELYVGGRGVAHGYAGCFAETAARFLPDPFSREPGARMYRTGDRARWNPDGTVQFLGRDDDQVKIRGHRVELAEVDRALLTYPGVRAAAVVIVGRRFPRMVAFLTGTGDLDVDSVRGHVATMLPRYMVPGEFRILTSLPVTTNGKVDRRRLAELASERDAPADAAEPDPLLNAVLEVFTEVLELPRAGPQDDLHELGGTSLGAVRIAIALSARLGIPVAVPVVLRYSRAADLAAAVARISAAGSVPTSAEADDLAEGGRPGPQQRWLMALERHLGHPAPAISALVETGGCRLEPAWVEAAVRRLAGRHDALAPLPDQAPVSLSAWQPCVVVVPPAEAELGNWRPDLVERPMPDGLPGIQAVLVRNHDGVPGRVLLLLARNRADGPSAVILARELRELLTGRLLPDPAPPYAEYLRSSALRWAADKTRLERYWIDTLAPVSPDPFRDRRPAGRGFRHQGVRWRIPVALDQRLSDRCAVLGVAPSALFLAALARTVTRTAHCSQVAVGVPVGLRSGAEIDRLVGRAVDMVPVVLPADCDPVRAHRALLQALDHAALPIERIARLVDPVDVAIRPPVCAVALFTHEYDDEPASATDAKTDLVPEHWSDVDLALHVEPGPAKRRCLVLTGEQRVFGLPELRVMLRDLDSLLRQFCHPTTDTNGCRDER